MVTIIVGCVIVFYVLFISRCAFVVTRILKTTTATKRHLKKTYNNNDNGGDEIEKKTKEEAEKKHTNWLLCESGDKDHI